MVGTQRMLRGFVIGAIGAAITYATFKMATPGGSYVVAWGAIAVGGLEFVIGLFQFIAHSSRSPEDKAKDHAHVSARVLAHSLIATAVADGEIKDAEIAAIREAVKRVTGEAMDERAIRTVAGNYAQGKLVLQNVLASGGAHLAKADRSEVIEEVAQFLRRNPQIDQQERARALEVGAALKLSKKDVEKLVPLALAAVA